MIEKGFDLRATVEMLNIEERIPREHLLKKIDSAVNFGYIGNGYPFRKNHSFPSMIETSDFCLLRIFQTHAKLEIAFYSH